MLKKTNIIPGFYFTLGYSLLYTSFIVLIPLSCLFIKTASLTFAEFLTIITDSRVIAAYKLTFLTAFIAALINSILGFILCWVIVRYNFVGKKIIDAIIDLPFALPTSIAGLSLVLLYTPEGILGKYLAHMGIQVAFTSIGICFALIFVGLPFVVRTIEPVLQNIEQDIEEAALILGAGRLKIFTKIIIPNILPAWITGFALAFARGIGEYGSVIFISSNIPKVSEIISLLITIKLEQFEYSAATAIAVVMLIISFMLLLIINILQLWSNRHDQYH
ncbi:Sulfate transport system permease protein CysT [Rickettsiales bacterium Ac37b]|nr:Sulfate transport system permease protein CysT [Rickettsiales bacterium Ac37b]